jgi:hypothetical protein
MAWILFLFAVGCFVAMFFTTSLALGIFCLLFSFALMLVATMLLLAARVGDATRNVDVLSPEELRVIREQADATRAANTAAAANLTASGTPSEPPPSASA